MRSKRWSLIGPLWLDKNMLSLDFSADTARSDIPSLYGTALWSVTSEQQTASNTGRQWQCCRRVSAAGTLGVVHSQCRSSREAVGSVASSFQLPAPQHALVRSGRIKNRSVVQVRVNKWQMLCISWWPVTTAGVKGHTDCCHMKSGILAVRRRSASHSALELGRLASAHYNVNRLAQTGFEQFLCLTHTVWRKRRMILNSVWCHWVSVP